MLKRNKKYYKRTDAAEKLALWQKELDSNLSIENKNKLN